MSGRIVFTLAVLLSLAHSDRRALAAVPERFITPDERIKQIIVKVAASFGGVEHLGAGIVVGHDDEYSYIATANHVARNRSGTDVPEDLLISFYWAPKVARQAHLLPESDVAMDLAVLAVPIHPDDEPALQGLPVDVLGLADTMSRGAPIYMVGHPSGRLWRINTSAEKFDTAVGDALEFESNLITRGHSGGGLLNERLELVGMLRSDRPPYGDAVNIAPILARVKAWGYPIRLSPFDVRVSSGESRTCRTNPNGLLRCLGTTQNVGYEEFVQIDEAPFKHIDVGGGHTCGIVASGETVCVGANRYGQLGDGSTTPRYDMPMLVSGNHAFVAVSAGYGHSCGVDFAGRTYCWGFGKHGQLGNGGKEDSAVPVPVVGNVEFVAISAGWLYTIGLSRDGSLYIWGDMHGSSVRPVVIGSNIKDISAGYHHACVIDDDGAIYCWGGNGSVSLGNGTAKKSYAEPQRVDSDVAFVAVSAGGFHSCALDAEGAAYCWGANQSGQLGDGTRLDKVRPGRVAQGLAFVSISAGMNHTCGVTQDRAVYCWGSNHDGELGIEARDTDQPVIFTGRAPVAEDDAPVEQAASTALQRGARDARDPSQQTPLHFAVLEGSLPAVQCLLSAGANPDAMTLREETALHMATTAGRLDLVKVLVEAGADINVRDRWQRNAYQIARLNGHAEVMQFLAKQGSTLEREDEDTPHALYIAAAEGNLERVKTAIEQGHDMHASFNDYSRTLPARLEGGGPHARERTALHAAVINGHSDVVQILLDAGADPNRWDGAGYSPFHLAVLTAQFDLAQTLLARGADLTWPINGYRPVPLLHEAVNMRNGQAVTFLIDAGFDIDTESSDRTALLLASEYGITRMVDLLLLLGADPNAGSPTWTAVAWAVSNNNEAILRALLKAGANVNGQAGSKTALHLALERRHFPLAVLLIDHGADVRIRDDRGISPLSYMQLPEDLGSAGLRELIAAVTQSLPRLGVYLDSLSSAQAAVIGQPTLQAVVISETDNKGAASAAGVRAGDIILTIEGVRVRAPGELILNISTNSPGDEVKLGLLRDGEPMEIEVVLGASE